MSAPFDVVIVGAGPVGLALALGLAQAGVRACLLGPRPGARDGRTAALLSGSVRLLERLGVWADLKPEAGALRGLRIVDDTESLFRPPPVTFQSAEIGEEAFGWNVENVHLAEILGQAVQAHPGLEWREVVASGFESEADRGIVGAEDGAPVSGRLVVAADGRRSRIREIAGIAVRERPYPQSAFTTVVAHAADHDEVSTEFHTRTGPFTLVPLPGRRSSLVWVTSPPHAARLLTADPEALAAAIEARSHSLLGAVRVDGPRGAVRLASIIAACLTAPRLALAGEAAHALPPLGAQGLNLGFADAEALLRLIPETLAAGEDPGGAASLARYERERSADIRVRAAAVDGLNRALLTAFAPLDAARGFGLGLLGRVGPLRRAVMRAGLGSGPVSSGTTRAASSLS